MAHTRPTPLDWALFFFLVGTWGSAYAITHVAIVHGAPPWLIVAGRLWAATAVLQIVLALRRAQGAEPPATKGVQIKLWAMGAFGAALPFALFSYAQLGAPSGLVGLYSALTPIIVVALAPLVAPEDRVTPAKALGIVLGFSGVAALMGPAAIEDLGSASMLAQVAAALGAACYAANTLIARAGKPIPALESAAMWTLYGAIISTPFALMQWPAAPLPWEALAAIGALAILPTALASIAYFYLISATGVVFVSQSNYLMPLWALALGAVAFAEPIGWNAVAALVLIVVGLFVAQEGWRALKLRPASGAR